MTEKPAETISRRTFLKGALGAATGGVAATLGTCAYKKVREVLHERDDAEIQLAVVSLLAQPQYGGQEFDSQILGPAELEVYDVNSKVLTFRVPRDEKDDIRLFIRPEAREGKELRVLPSIQGEAMFRFEVPLAYFHVDPDKVLRFPYRGAVYRITPRQLLESMDEKGVYGGKHFAEIGPGSGIVNHGRYVASAHNPSVRDFANELKEHLHLQSREDLVQAALSLVTDEIKYDKREAMGNVQVMRRATDSLMSRNATCSGKTILLASLLSQYGEDCLLLYSHHHIAVAVKAGDFPRDNGYHFQYRNEQWMLAETTVSGFQIGKTRLQVPFDVGAVRYMQKPDEVDRIYDAAGNPLPMRDQ